MSSAISSEQDCLVCGVSDLVEIDEYRTLKRVTSEVKPFKTGGRLAVCSHCESVQKILDEPTRREIDTIYSSYDLYPLSGGIEQPIFDLQGAHLPRSARIINYIKQVMDLSEDGSLLDFGCGRGATLAQFSAAFPGWRNYGCELSDASRSLLEKIPQFSGLFVCGAEEIPGKYDLITMIHSLEHVFSPVDVIRELGARLSGDGALLIQVPDCYENPYDLLIAEHVTHFTPDTLARTAMLAGMQAIGTSSQVAVKELTWIGRPASNPTAPSEWVCNDVRAKVLRDIAWLQAQADLATGTARSSTAFGIFGSATSGTWLAGVLETEFDFFVDEDPLRQGQTHLGKPVIPPSEIPEGADVFVPLIPRSADAVVERLSRNLPNVRFHKPPSDLRLD